MTEKEGTEMDRMTEVVAGLLWREENGCLQMLAGKRPQSKTRAGLWEFIGGKVEPGETPEQALKREFREETDLEIQVGELFTEVIHQYPDITVHLRIYHAEIRSGEPKPMEHQEFRWMTPAEIGDYPFCPADEEILKKISWETDWLKPGIYRHFKGKKYRVLGLARHSETLEQTVVYQALYGDGKMWVRPAKMWVTPVETDGKTIQRFTYLGES